MQRIVQKEHNKGIIKKDSLRRIHNKGLSQRNKANGEKKRKKKKETKQGKNDRYQAKIKQIIKDNDMNQLGKHLFLRPNCILSMIDDAWSGPYLNIVGYNGSIEMYELFLDCLFHFGEVLLNEKEPLNYNENYHMFDKNVVNSCLANHKLFVQKYFNFSLGGIPCVSGYKFVKYICCGYG